jgi:hypothetical protein
VDTLKVLHLEH